MATNKDFDMPGMIPYFAPMTNELKQHGLKVTAPRTKILHLLENADEAHLSAEQIYQLLHEDNDRTGDWSLLLE